MRTMLERIAEAEQQADKIIEEANAKAREQIATAKAEAEAAVAQELDAERRKTAQSLANAEERGKELRDEIISSVLSDPCRTTNPVPVTEEVVRRVLGEVTGHG